MATGSNSILVRGEIKFSQAEGPAALSPMAMAYRWNTKRWRHDDDLSIHVAKAERANSKRVEDMALCTSGRKVEDTVRLWASVR